MLQKGRDILEIIKLIREYNPSNQGLYVANFQKFLDNLETMNNEVTAAYNEAIKATQERAKLYDTLRTNFQQIKSYVASEYGKSSDPYQNIMKIKY